MPSRKSTGGAAATETEHDSQTNGATAASTASQTAAAKRVEAQQTKALKDAGGVDQFELPKSSITKLAKSEVSRPPSSPLSAHMLTLVFSPQIPDNVQLRKEVVLALVKASTVFVSYLTSTSHDLAVAQSHKTISAANVLDAIKELEFPPDMRTQLKAELEGTCASCLPISSALPRLLIFLDTTAFRALQQAKRKKAPAPAPAAAAGKSKDSGAGADESMDADISRLDGADDPDETMQREDGQDGQMLRAKMAGAQNEDDQDEEDQFLDPKAAQDEDDPME